MNDLEKYIVYDTFTIKEVMESFENNNERVAIVLNSNKKVIGVISQGDIIKFLIEGNNIYIKVKQIYKPSFIYTKEKNMPKIYNIFKNKQITLVPIIDDDFNLIDIISLKDIFNFLENKY